MTIVKDHSQDSYGLQGFLLLVARLTVTGIYHKSLAMSAGL